MHANPAMFYGDVSPSAALTYTIAKTEDDYPRAPVRRQRASLRRETTSTTSIFIRMALSPVSSLASG